MKLPQNVVLDHIEIIKQEKPLKTDKSANTSTSTSASGPGRPMNKSRHPCEHCGTPFSSQRKLNEHMTQKHKNSIRKHLCTICSKSFIWLQKHMQILHEPQENHCCDTCGKEFKYKMLLSNHVRNVHEVTGDQCDRCSKICKNRAALQKHIKYNHN